MFSLTCSLESIYSRCMLSCFFQHGGLQRRRCSGNRTKVGRISWCKSWLYLIPFFFVSIYKLSLNYPSLLTTVQGSKDDNNEDAPFPNNRTVCISGQSSEKISLSKQLGSQTIWVQDKLSTKICKIFLSSGIVYTRERANLETQMPFFFLSFDYFLASVGLGRS